MSRKSEVDGVAKILLSTDEYETVEDCAKAIIRWLDADRNKRTSYVGVMQFGIQPNFYAGVGPFPGWKSARKALEGHPAAGEATAMAVVPVLTAEGLAEQVKQHEKRVK